MSSKRAICAMSGGVDSSVAAYLLKKDGYEVIGVTCKLWDCFKAPVRQTCCSTADTEDARRVCEQIGILHHVVDMREAFRKNVVEYFVKEYATGRTPNPCCKCNELLKFRLLREECVKLFDTDLIATGHYARILGVSLRAPEGGVAIPCIQLSSRDCFVATAPRNDMLYSLFKGIDSSKDQSYFLFTLTTDDLGKTLFPLGELTKNEVRKIAFDVGIKTAEKSESQEVCFVPDNDYAGFISDYYPGYAHGCGDFVDANGNKIGRHEGAHAYTIGQRRGLGIGFGRRRYVIKINVAKNEVVLGNNSDLFKKEMIVKDVHWLCHSEPRRGEESSGAKTCGDSHLDPSSAYGGIRMTVKIRYRHEGASAMITPLSGGYAKVEFEEPQRAITPGQAAVFYDGDEVIGGGWIEESV